MLASVCRQQLPKSLMQRNFQASSGAGFQVRLIHNPYVSYNIKILMKVSLSLKKNGDGTKEMAVWTLMPSAASLAVEQQKLCTGVPYPCTAALDIQALVWPWGTGCEKLLVWRCIWDGAHMNSSWGKALLRGSCSRSWLETVCFQKCAFLGMVVRGGCLSAQRGLPCHVLLLLLQIFHWGIECCGSSLSFCVECYFQSKNNHDAIAADGFLSNPLELVGQQFSELQVISHQSSWL